MPISSPSHSPQIWIPTPVLTPQTPALHTHYNKIDMSPTLTYEDAIENLSALIPELFSTPTQPRRKFSLAEIGTLSAALGNPHQKFPSVLIAGTNGKGSTASTLASIARAAGLRTGLYTSPHLDRVNERIKLNGADIPDQTFARLYFSVHETAVQLVQQGKLPAHPSYFELLTALAFLYFAEPEPGASPVDLAILEVGMGGRLDATNLVTPILSVITDISLDHQEWLGSTIDLIAREKAGILRPRGTLVTLPQHPEANQAIGEVATELDVRAISATQYMSQLNTSPTEPYPLEIMGQQILIDSPLKGSHQHRNIALAIAAAVDLAQTQHFPITPAAIEQGIKTTQWPGRFERIHFPSQPEFILDVAHNPAGAWALRSALNTPLPALQDTGIEAGAPPFSRTMRKGWETSNPDQIQGSPHSVLIFACLRDKPLREMTQILFPLFDHVILAPIHSPRATEVADLLAAAEATGVPSTPVATVAEAIQKALQLNPARIVISGSVYLVGEARTMLLPALQQGRNL
jgi:dihydrofolate synthase/folylpolyglutamate synthase